VTASFLVPSMFRSRVTVFLFTRVDYCSITVTVFGGVRTFKRGTVNRGHIIAYNTIQPSSRKHRIYSETFSVINHAKFLNTLHKYCLMNSRLVAYSEWKFIQCPTREINVRWHVNKAAPRTDHKHWQSSGLDRWDFDTSSFYVFQSSNTLHVACLLLL